MDIPVDVMENQQIGSWDAWKEYQSNVVHQTNDALNGISLDQLLKEIGPSLPERWAMSYLGHMVSQRKPSLRLLDLIEGTVYAHGLRHIGEVEYGRSWVGLSGLTM